MTDTPSRVFGLLAVLIGVWVLVYWLYEPRTPRVTSDAMRPAAASAASLPPIPVQAPPPAPVVEESRPVQPPKVEAPPPEPAIEPVIEPQFTQYIVQRGDNSFEAIAQRIYKDRRKWEIIARANPFVTSDRLKPGKTVLNIPVDPGNIQGKPNPEYGRQQAAEGAGGGSRATSYVIQRDDTLWGIAKKVYGQGAMWREIYEANRDKIKNPDRPPAGVELTIPPKPAS